jgi:hypothetical protein
MRAITVLPGMANSARLDDIPPPSSDGAILARTLALGVCGTDREIVNANRRHCEMAAQALARANKHWLASLITRRVPVARWHEALERRGDDIKLIVDFGA